MAPPSVLAALGRAKSAAPVRTVFLGVEGGVWTGEDGFFPCREWTDPVRAKDWGKGGVLPGGCVAHTGKDYELTSTLEPLRALKSDFNILSGLHHKHDTIPNSVVNGHGQDLGTLLTGQNISSTPGVALRNGISIDQLIAQGAGMNTRVASLALTVGHGSYNTREASGLGYMGFLSYDENGNALPTEGDPAAVFDRLFTDGSGRQKSERDAERRRKRSVLDAILGDMKSLDGRVPSEDRQRLDEYATAIRDVERRIEKSVQWENNPITLPPGAVRPETGQDRGSGARGEDRVQRMRLMLDVLVLALQTDVTRVATLRLGGYYGSFGFLGFPEDPHGVYAHNGGSPERVAGAKAIDRLHVEQLAYFLARLKATPDADGVPLLDNCVVLYGAGLTNGPSRRVQGDSVHFDAHGQVNTPLLVAGKGGGAFQTGRHLNFDHGTPLANVLVSIAGAAGVPDIRFSDSTGPLAGLG